MGKQDILFERLANLLESTLRQQAVDAGLQAIHVHILRYLTQANRYSDSLSALVDYVGATKGTLSQSVSLLVERKWIEKITDPKDQRRVHLHVTTVGRQVLQQLYKSNPVMSVLQNEAVEGVSSFLEICLRRIQHEHGKRAFGLCAHCKHHEIVGERSRRCGLTGEPLSKADSELLCREFEYVE